MGFEQASWPPEGGKMGAIMRMHDWASTPLGPITGWSEGLIAAVGMMLNTCHPASIAWGPDLIFLYNDGVASMLGADKHPRILGRPAAEAWSEAHALVEAEIRGVLNGGPAVWSENRLIPISRDGVIEEAYWTYSRSPIPDRHAPGGIGGVLTLTTENTRSVLAARESEARFRALFEQSPILVHILDPRGQTVAVNPALQRAFGVTQEAMRAYNIFDDPQLGAGPPREMLERLFAGDVVRLPPLKHDAMVSVGEGKARWVEAMGYPVKDDQGEIRELVILAQDVTARVEAETALGEAEARFRIAREAAQLGIFDFDFRSGCCVWDERIRGLWGAEPAEIVTDEIFKDGIHPDDRAAVEAALARAVDPSGSGEYRAEYRVVHRRTGETRWLMATGRAFLDNGTPRRLVGTVQDISDRHSYEEALRGSEERLQIGLAAGQLGHWTWDAATDHVDFSPRAREIFGISPSVPLTWRLIQKLIEAEEAQLAAAAVESSLASGEDYMIEYRIRKPDGGRGWVAARGRPIYSAAGAPSGMIGVVQDITERKASEEKIRLLMAEVNHRSKNMLAVVQSIAHQTSARGSPQSFARRFSERLQGLAASHDILVNNAWQGAGLSELVSSQLSHFRDLVRQRIVFEGPDVELTPAAAQALGMALHELATNAGKYGSLSNGGGRVEIGWRIEADSGDQRFRMSWTESGGPDVKPPASRGFGTTLIARMTEVALQGQVSLDYAPTGMRWSIDAPLAAVTAAGATLSAPGAVLF